MNCACVSRNVTLEKFGRIFKINLAKTRWGPQVVKPAMAVKDRIRVATERFLISSSHKEAWFFRGLV